MTREIERKFLVAGDGWRSGVVSSRRMRQFYLSEAGNATVRIRIEDAGGAWLTIKSAESGIARAEFEYPIPVAHAEAMAALRSGAIIDKVRHIVPHGEHEWEVDVFAGENEGLVIAEVELDGVDERPEIPAWVGAEVTDERRYFNASLVHKPFKSW